ncbi:MAG: molybdate ABC transporter permease subunit [Armatimonadetes bacterium]|nr:molybdate ABC transporter permease subunit [Armatimonadota bacterium]
MNNRAFRWTLGSLGLLYGSFLLLPLAALAWRASPQILWSELMRPETWSAVAMSLTSATIATLVTVAGGLPMAYILATSEGRWTRLATTILELPLVLPPAVAGLGLILAFGRYQLLGPLLSRLGIEHVALTRTAVVMAQMLVSAPLFFRAARTAFGMVPERYLRASAVLGAREATTFRLVVLPLARGGLVGGALLCWARALGELGATLMFAGNLPGVTRTMPTAIYIKAQSDITTAVTLSLLLLLLSVAALLAARQVAGEAAS